MLQYLVILVILIAQQTNANIDSKRLYDDLMSGYNKLIRPVTNNSYVFFFSNIKYLLFIYCLYIFFYII